jgi:hypothetical protein
VNAKRELLTNSIAPRIKAVLTAAEQTAALVTQEAESEASRRTNEVLAGAYADAERIRREATRRVEEYLAASSRRIDAFATARIERISELTEGVIEASTSIQDRFEQAAAIQREVHGMVEALGTVAEAVAREAAQASPTLPAPPASAVHPEGGPGWAQTGPDGSVVGEAHVNGAPLDSSPDVLEGDVGGDGYVQAELGEARGGEVADALETGPGNARDATPEDHAGAPGSGGEEAAREDEVEGDDRDGVDPGGGEMAPA